MCSSLLTVSPEALPQLQGSLVMKGVGRDKDEPGESQEHAWGRACLQDLGTLPPLRPDNRQERRKQLIIKIIVE